MDETKASSSPSASDEGEPQIPRLDTSNLPEDLASAVMTVQEQLEQGELGNALESLNGIKGILRDSERFSQNNPIDLQFERLQFMKSHVLEKEQPKFTGLKVVCPPEQSPKPLSEFSAREVYKLSQASTKCRGEKYAPVQFGDHELKASPFAVLIELSSQCTTVPMYVAPSSYEQATAVVKCNFELGAFLNILPLYGEKTPSESDSLTAFRHILAMQKVLRNRNYNFPAQSPLHMLATLASYSTADTELLNTLLDTNSSIQACTLSQSSIEKRTPLIEAIVYGNIDFIRAVLRSQAAFSMPYAKLMPMDSEALMKALIRQFAPAGDDEYDQRAYKQDARYKFQIEFITSLQEHLTERASRGDSSLQDLATTTSNQVCMFIDNLMMNPDAPSTKQWLNTGQKLIEAPDLEILQLLIREGKSKVVKDCAVAALFSHPSLFSGQLIMQMSMSMSKPELASLFEKVPGLHKIFFSISCPLTTKFPAEQKHAASEGYLYPFHESLDTQEFTIKHTDFPLSKFPSKVINHCYSLKLALLRKPDDSALHEYISDNMDFDNLTEPLLQFEILCYFANFKGCDDPRFKLLFKKQVWLMGQSAPGRRDFKLCGKNAGSLRFDPLRKIYPDAEIAYKNMVVSLGKHLIRHHAVQLFEEFICSLRSVFMPDTVVAIFIKESIAHYSMDCAAVLYALCNPEGIDMKVKPGVAKKDCDTISVTAADIQATSALCSIINNKNTKNQSIGLVAFLNIAPPKASDRCIRLVLEYRMISWKANIWARSESKRPADLKMKNLKTKRVDAEQKIISAILSKVNVERFTWVVKELAKCAKLQSEQINSKTPSVMLVFQLVNFFSQKWQNQACDDIKPTRYMKNHERQMKIMFSKQMMQAMNSQNQRTMIKESLNDDTLAQTAADWIGVDVALYREESQKALAVVEKRAFFTEKRYFKWEIGQPMAAISSNELCETGQNEEPSLIKIRASCGTAQPTYTYFEGLITKQKFEAVKDLMLSMMDDFSTIHHYMFFLTYFKTKSGVYSVAIDKKSEKKISREDSWMRGLLKCLQYSNPFNSRGQVKGANWALPMLESLLTKSFKNLVEQLQSLKLKQQKQIFETFGEVTFDVTEKSTETRVLKKLYVKMLNTVRENLCKFVVADLDKLCYILELNHRINQKQRSEKVEKKELKAEQNRVKMEKKKNNKIEGESSSSDSCNSSESSDNSDSSVSGASISSDEEDLKREWEQEPLSEPLYKQAKQIGNGLVSKNEQDDEYMRKPALQYFIDAISIIIIEKQDICPQYRKSLVSIMLYAASSETICSLFDADLLKETEHLNIAAEQGRNYQPYKTFFGLLRLPFARMSMKAKAAMSITFMNSIKQKHPSDNLEYIKGVAPILNHIVRQRVFKQSAELSKVQLCVNYKDFAENPDMLKKLLHSSDEVLKALVHIYNGEQEGTDQMAATPRLKELQAVQTVNFTEMEAEIRVPPSEEVKGWIAEVRQQLEDGLGPKQKQLREKRKQGDMKYDSDSEDSAIFDPKDDANEVAAAKVKPDSGLADKETDGEEEKKDKKDDSTDQSHVSVKPVDATPVIAASPAVDSKPNPIKPVPIQKSSSCCTII